MARAKQGRAKKLILDIGSSAVRLCELTRTKQGFQLTKYHHREFGIDPSLDEEEQHKIRLEVVRNLLKETKSRYRKVVFGVPGQSVFTRTRALPPVPDYKVTQIVRYEIQQQIPFGLDQIAFDYQVLQRTEAGGYEVLMAAIKVDVVEKRLRLIRDLKKQVDIVDVSPLAAYNWLKYTREFGEAGECVALIDLGASTTDIVIERDNQFRFTRSLNLGGNDVTSAIAAEFNVSFAEAEKIKRERGFAPTGDPARDGRGGEVIGKVLNRLVTEIGRSFSYFRSQPGGGAVTRIIVTGGGACLRNVVPYLQRQLGVEVRIAQPLAGLVTGPGAQEVNEHPEQAAVALGLALRCNEKVTLAINLIPPRIREAARRREQAVYWLLSVFTLVLIMLSIVPVMAQQNRAILEQIEIVKAEIKRYDQSLIHKPGSPLNWKSEEEGRIAELTQEITSYQQKVQTLDAKLQSRRPWLEDLVAINDARPKQKLVVFRAIETTQIGPPGGLSQPRGLAALTSTAPLGWSSTGFEGISPMGSTSASRGLIALAGGPTAKDPMGYNGLSLYGFAEDSECLAQFLENLKKCPRFITDGVYFDDRFTDPVPMLELDRASAAAGGPAASTAQGPTALDDLERDRGGGNLGRLREFAGSSRASTPASNPFEGTKWSRQGNVLSFRVDLQYAGEKVAPLAAATGAEGGTEDALEKMRRMSGRRAERRAEEGEE